MISKRWSFTVKRSPYTVHWSLSRSIVHTEKKQWRNIHQQITKGSQTLHGDLDVQRSSLRLWAMQGPLESENEICCLTSLYWNPHFYQNVEDQGQTETRSGYMSQWWVQSHRIFVSEAISDCMIPILVKQNPHCVCVCACDAPEKGYVELQEVIYIYSRQLAAPGFLSV